MTTPIALRDWRLLAAGCGGLLLLAAAITLHSHWGDFLQWCLATQITLHRYLVMYLLLLNNHQYSGGIWLLVGAFLYGVLHAVGPGHGKFIVTTYLSTNQESLTAARMVPFLGSLLQGVTAILFVFILAVGLNLAAGDLREGANKQVISSQADSLIKISRIWADFFPANNRISLFRLFFPPFLALFPVFTEISPTDVSFGPP
ncbi:nickel/cobalt transporter, partial [Klebsiella pneumoniae]|uniref:nickel/cobalt transporter n=1 Tax=Klebsiella pneumoniae TaxID=573 RepID=UPI003970AF88